MLVYIFNYIVTFQGVYVQLYQQNPRQIDPSVVGYINTKCNIPVLDLDGFLYKNQ